MERHPLLLGGAAAVLGAACVIPFDAPTHRVLLAAAAGCSGWALLVREPGRIRAMVACALAAGAFSAWLHLSRQPAPVRAHTGRFACTVLAHGTQNGDLASYTCAADGGAVLAIDGVGAPPAEGSHVLVRGRIEPFDAPRNPGEPDEREIERERGVYARVANAHVLAHLPPAPLDFAIALARVHAWALAQLRLRLPEPDASIVAGELWGERSALPPDLRAEFQETGTVHILVTAGLHLGAVAALVLAVLRLCTVPRAWTCAIAIAALWLYAAFSGMHLPSMRAATMLSFALTAYAFGAASQSWNAYGAALGAIAIFDPQSVAGASFALSFSCVGAILLLADGIAAKLEAASIPHALREAIALAAATQAGTWPLTASIFLLFAPYAILANLAVVPAVATTMLLGALQLAFSALPPLAQAVANLNDGVLTWMLGVVRTLSSLPGAAIPATPAPAWAIAAYDASLAAAAYCAKRSARTPALCLAVFGVLLVLAPPVAPDRRLRITVLDVGQADGIVVQTPLGHTLLVDAGGRLERGSFGGSSAERVGERIVVPFLRRAGVRRIDALILSHPHGDHAGGMAPVLRAFAVDEFADSGQRYAGHAYNDAMQTARDEQVPILYPRAGTVWRTNDGVALTFIGPSLPFIESDNTINDNSIAFMLQYKHFRMLFTGDAGIAAEQRFLNEGTDLHADVLKVGHHGSAYSSSTAFIAAVDPRFAVISVGRHNMFGHPAPSTIGTLHRFGVRIYRTDENAAVTIISDGTSSTIEPMLP